MTQTPKQADTEIRPFTIETPDGDLKELHDRLDRTRWPAEVGARAGAAARRSTT
jgi:epoxide hydrolase